MTESLSPAGEAQVPRSGFDFAVFRHTDESGASPNFSRRFITPMIKTHALNLDAARLVARRGSAALYAIPGANGVCVQMQRSDGDVQGNCGYMSDVSQGRVFGYERIRDRNGLLFGFVGDDVRSVSLAFEDGSSLRPTIHRNAYFLSSPHSPTEARVELKNGHVIETNLLAPRS